jgi:hypothetical protein
MDTCRPAKTHSVCAHMQPAGVPDRRHQRGERSERRSAAWIIHAVPCSSQERRLRRQWRAARHKHKAHPLFALWLSGCGCGLNDHTRYNTERMSSYNVKCRACACSELHDRLLGRRLHAELQWPGLLGAFGAKNGRRIMAKNSTKKKV